MLARERIQRSASWLVATGWTPKLPKPQGLAMTDRICLDSVRSLQSHVPVAEEQHGGEAIKK